MHIRRWVPLAGLLLAAAVLVPGCNHRASSASAASAAKAPAPAPIPLRLGDAVVIGASVSAGAEVTLPGMPPQMFGGDAGLADALGAATQGPAPASLADMMFFVRADQTAAKQLDAAKSKNPAAVFAIDYLFWHAYGSPLSDDQRRKLFERGLDRLATLNCPVVVADLPDMSHAIDKMLMKSQVPSAAVQEELNARLEAWAKDRPNVVVIHLRETVRNAMAGQPLTLGGRRFEGDAARGLLVANGLHCTADGLVALALECLDRMKARGVVPANSIWDHDADSIKRRLTETRLEARKAKSAGEVGGGTSTTLTTPQPAKR
jgi:hypothetical protein